MPQAPTAPKPHTTHAQTRLVPRAEHGAIPRGLPNPVAWSIHLVRAVIEVQAGRRTTPQLSGWAANEAIESLCRQGALGGGTVRSARAMRVGPNEVEAVVLVDLGPRTRAITLRLVGVNMPLRPSHRRQRSGPRWLATHLQLV